MLTARTVSAAPIFQWQQSAQGIGSLLEHGVPASRGNTHVHFSPLRLLASSPEGLRGHALPVSIRRAQPLGSSRQNGGIGQCLGRDPANDAQRRVDNFGIRILESAEDVGKRFLPERRKAKQGRPPDLHVRAA